MKKYNIYGMGAAIVDTEVVVSDSFIKDNDIGKGLMTLVDAERQKYLIDSLTTQRVPVKMSCGGSACNSVVAASMFGSSAFFSGKVANDEVGDFFVKDLKKSGVDFHQVDPSSGVTGKCLVMVTPDAARTMNTNLGASLELTYREVDEEQGFGLHLPHEEDNHDLAVFVIAWAPGRGLAAHNHKTWAVVAGIEGQEHETNYRRLDDGLKSGFAQLEKTHEETILAGNVVCCMPEDIHSVHNNGAQIAVSLHTYGRHLNYTGRSLFDSETHSETPCIVKITDE